MNSDELTPRPNDIRQHFTDTVLASPKFYDVVFAYEGYGRHESKCRIRAYQNQHDRRRVVVVLTDMEGTSVTNAAEQIASSALNLIGAESERDSITWVEHYPKVRGDEEHFAFITFSHYDAHGPYFALNASGKCFSGRGFQPATRSEILDLVGGSL